MFDNIKNFIKKIGKKEEKNQSQDNSKNAAKERLHLVLMQDRANVSADFLELMKQEIIEVIKKYIEIDEKEIDVRLTNKENEDGTNGAPALYANIPILNIKNEARKLNKTDIENKKDNENQQESKNQINKDNKESQNMENQENKEIVKNYDIDRQQERENRQEQDNNNQENEKIEEHEENIDNKDAQTEEKEETKK